MVKMTPSEGAYALIRYFEGLRLDAYQDVAGYWTIGYGHRFLNAHDFIGRITKEDADRLLIKDAAIASRIVSKYTYVKLNQNQFDALVSFVFNVGAGHFLDSTLRKLLNSSDYVGAAEQLYRWDKVKGEVNHWLLLRRDAEHDLFMGDADK